jgi:hypothetical protein
MIWAGAEELPVGEVIDFATVTKPKPECQSTAIDVERSEF